MNPNTPQRKVVAGGLTGAIGIIAGWTLEQFGITVPLYIYGAINTVIVFIVQYAVPNYSEIPDA